MPKKTSHLLLLLINLIPFILYGITIVWLSNVGSGSEILFIVISPLILVTFLAVIMIDFVLIARYLIKARKQSQPDITKRRAASIGLLVIASLILVVFSRLINISTNSYEGGRRVSENKAIEYINACQVYSISKTEEVEISLKTSKNPANPPDWVEVKAESYENLVSAANKVGTKCGNVDVDDYALVDLSKALEKINACRVEVIAITDDSTEADQVSVLELDLKPDENHKGAQEMRIRTSLANKEAVLDATTKATPVCGAVPVENYNV